MTGVEVTEKDASPKKKDTSPKNKKEKSPKLSKKDRKNDLSDDSSVCSSTGEKAKNWLGREVKRPRAEYQAEIDELKLKLAALETEVLTKTNQLDAFQDWIRQIPSAYQESVEL
ncbi:unnamed protein product [Pseudo-nitzschia multistriata]|uniref:Uncharacterized protein n=1 Tax=Pseudo-nitzschia multistriata TaxID=183589 RepID=A0A448Z2I0_9STRA|nr:unnamed protein product [Pseudo-nitzschia multistriata]